MSSVTVSLRDPISLVVGATACQVIGGLVPQMSPFVIAGLIEGLSLSERDAGIVASVELLMLAAAAFAVAPFLRKWPFKQSAFLAVSLTLLSQVASTVTNAWWPLVALRGVAGLGEGALYAMSLTVVAIQCRNPEKVFGCFQLVWAIGSIGLFAIGGEVTAMFAHQGIFVLMMGITLACSPFVFLIPNIGASKNTEPATVGTTPTWGAILFTAIVLYITVSAGLFAFSGPMSDRVGLNTNELGYILTASTLVGLAGAAAATTLNVRWGRAIPVSVFCLGYLIVVMVLCLWPNAWAFGAAVIGSAVLYYFSLPYLFGLAAALDPSGRCAAAAGAANLFGFAVGPIFAGAVITSSGYAGLAAACAVMVATAWTLAMLIVGYGSMGRSISHRGSDSIA